MYFRNYRYFLAIVEHGGLSRAAEALYLSQPSLSKYVKKLEEELEVELFDHTSSPLQLTYAGQRYYEYVKRLQSLERQFADELTDIRGDRAGVIRVGIAPWRGSVLLPALLPAFREVYPHVEIEILEGRSQQIETALIQGKLDLCLMNLPSHFPAQTVQEILWHERMLLVAHKEHPAVADLVATGEELPSIDIRFLENEHFITMKPGQNIALATQRLFAANELTPKSTWATENMTTAINMVSQGMGFTMMPEAGMRIAAMPENLAFFSVSHAKELFPFAAVYRKGFVLGKQIRTLLELAKGLYAEN